MSEPPGGSSPITFLSPTSYERLRACPLQASFAASPGRGAVSGSASARLGSIAHAVLESVVRSGSIRSNRWAQAFDEAWIVQVEKERARDVMGGVDPDRWPDYQLKRARTRRTAAKLREMLLALPAACLVLPEEPLSSQGGSLRGRADLIVRGPVHAVLDYKSGEVLDAIVGTIHEAYERQLLLYSYMEAETTGTWPTMLEVIPLTGPAVVVAADPSRASTLARDAAERRSAYNSLVPGPQPARVSVIACPRCPYSARCPAFWLADPSERGPDVVALRGTVRRVMRSGDLVTFGIETGPDGARSIAVVRAVDVREHAVAGAIAPDSAVAIVGLRPEEDRGTFRLRPGGAIVLSANGQDMKQ